ncbi:MAG: hypothetical protein IPK32_08815 [Verrucomicrobiaceae bacterium]|nr:hypothetical protein [Verrucomicrobiaceae bacterium]
MHQQERWKMAATAKIDEGLQDMAEAVSDEWKSLAENGSIQGELACLGMNAVLFSRAAQYDLQAIWV